MPSWTIQTVSATDKLTFVMLRLIYLFPWQPTMLLTKEKDGSFSVENIECCLIYQEGVAHNLSIDVEKIVFCNCGSECNDMSFHCLDPGKYHYSPERLKKSESCQADDFHLGGRKGRRRSGKRLLILYPLSRTRTSLPVSVCYSYMV